jgi:hydroxyethylthiazole kinase
LERIRSRKPLVHYMTNFVVMNDAVNVTLAIGASPIMAYVREEADSLGYAGLDVVEKLA